MHVQKYSSPQIPSAATNTDTLYICLHSLGIETVSTFVGMRATCKNNRWELPSFHSSPQTAFGQLGALEIAHLPDLAATASWPSHSSTCDTRCAQAIPVTEVDFQHALCNFSPHHAEHCGMPMDSGRCPGRSTNGHWHCTHVAHSQRPSRWCSSLESQTEFVLALAIKASCVHMCALQAHRSLIDRPHKQAVCLCRLVDH